MLILQISWLVNSFHELKEDKNNIQVEKIFKVEEEVEELTEEAEELEQLGEKKDIFFYLSASLFVYLQIKFIIIEGI